VDERVLISAHIRESYWVVFEVSNYFVKLFQTLLHLFFSSTSIDEHTKFSSLLTAQSSSVVFALIQVEELKLYNLLGLGIGIIS